jgi:hypothetical protein
MAKRDESQGEIDWASAAVADGVLTVPLGGEPSKAWAERVADVLDRLQRTGSGSGSIKVTRKEVTVQAVRPGTEGDLRHLLEGAVMQANADFAPQAEEAEDGGGDGEPENEADREMTDAFRTFGAGGPEEEEDPNESADGQRR